MHPVSNGLCGDQPGTCLGNLGHAPLAAIGVLNGRQWCITGPACPLAR